MDSPIRSRAKELGALSLGYPLSIIAMVWSPPRPWYTGKLEDGKMRYSVQEQTVIVKTKTHLSYVEKWTHSGLVRVH
jgi:hypothetical protein